MCQHCIIECDASGATNKDSHRTDHTDKCEAFSTDPNTLLFRAHKCFVKYALYRYSVLRFKLLSTYTNTLSAFS